MSTIHQTIFEKAARYLKIQRDQLFWAPSIEGFNSLVQQVNIQDYIGYITVLRDAMSSGKKSSITAFNDLSALAKLQNDSPEEVNTWITSMGCQEDTVHGELSGSFSLQYNVTISSHEHQAHIGVSVTIFDGKLGDYCSINVITGEKQGGVSLTETTFDPNSELKVDTYALIKRIIPEQFIDTAYAFANVLDYDASLPVDLTATTKSPIEIACKHSNILQTLFEDKDANILDLTAGELDLFKKSIRENIKVDAGVVKWNREAFTQFPFENIKQACHILALEPNLHDYCLSGVRDSYKDSLLFGTNIDEGFISGVPADVWAQCNLKEIREVLQGARSPLLEAIQLKNKANSALSVNSVSLPSNSL